MSIGKDVSMLYPSIVSNMETKNFEIKKLIYLYLIYYSKKNKELAIMCTNTFRKDCDDQNNPLLRVLALKTISNIQNEEIQSFLIEKVKANLFD